MTVLPRRGARRDDDLGRVRRLLLAARQHVLVGLDARLALGLPGGGRAADPLLLLGELALARALLALLLGQALALLLQVGGVVALVGDAAAAVDLQDPAGDVVEEVAVVGDDQHRARVVAQRPLQPGDALGVQVVGRLVEQQQVRLLEQQAAQRDAAALAARQVRRPGSPPAGSAARPARSPPCGPAPSRWRRRCAPAARPARPSSVFISSSDISSAKRIGDLVEAVEVRLEAGEGLHDVLAHRLVRVEMRLLRQVADARAPAPPRPRRRTPCPAPP